MSWLLLAHVNDTLWVAAWVHPRIHAAAAELNAFPRGGRGDELHMER